MPHSGCLGKDDQEENKLEVDSEFKKTALQLGLEDNSVDVKDLLLWPWLLLALEGRTRAGP